MTPRNKPGGLAVVIGSRYDARKIGLIVRTIKVVPDGFILVPAWSSEGIQRVDGPELSWLVIHEPTGRQWLHGDARLLPINPDELEYEDQTEKEIENQ